MHLTNKEKNNQLFELDFDISKLFTSKNNITYLQNRLYSEYASNGLNNQQLSESKFNSYLIDTIALFQLQNDLNNVSMAYEEAMGFKDHIEIIKYINAKFINLFRSNFYNNAYNPYRDGITLSINGKLVKKNIYDIQPEDYNRMVSWIESDTYSDNSIFKNNNKIPYRQRILHNRHYDKTEYTPVIIRENKIYGYDMRNFIKK
jgi:hypothetical protein